LECPAEVVALNAALIAFASWDEKTVRVFSLSSGELVKSVEEIRAVAMSFSEQGLLMLDCRDRLLVGDGDSIKEVRCDGLHLGLFECDNGSFVICGEQPVIFQDGVIKGFEHKPFSSGCNNGSNFALVAGDELCLCSADHFSMSVHDSRCPLNIIDGLQIGSKFVMAVSEENAIWIGISDHPLDACVRVDGVWNEYTGMATIEHNGKRFLAVLFGRTLVLFEFSDGLLQVRSSTLLDNLPISITAFEERFIVGFPRRFSLFETDLVSLNDIRLRKVSDMVSQGSTRAIQCDDEVVAVCDSLQSLVLYTFDDGKNKFNEIARNCMDLRLELCACDNDFFFCIDGRGRLFQMAISETHNMDSADLMIVANCNLGGQATVMGLTGSRVLIGMQSGEFLEVFQFLSEMPRKRELFESLYRQIEKDVQTIGKFNSRMHRVVMIGRFVMKTEVMFDLSLLSIFLKLDEGSQGTICAKAGVDIGEARSICEEILSKT
jgi:hypothetical protein